MSSSLVNNFGPDSISAYAHPITNALTIVETSVPVNPTLAFPGNGPCGLDTVFDSDSRVDHVALVIRPPTAWTTQPVHCDEKDCHQEAHKSSQNNDLPLGLVTINTDVCNYNSSHLGSALSSTLTPAAQVTAADINQKRGTPQCENQLPSLLMPSTSKGANAFDHALFQTRRPLPLPTFSFSLPTHSSPIPEHESSSTAPAQARSRRAAALSLPIPVFDLAPCIELPPSPVSESGKLGEEQTLADSTPFLRSFVSTETDAVTVASWDNQAPEWRLDSQPSSPHAEQEQESPLRPVNVRPSSFFQPKPVQALGNWSDIDVSYYTHHDYSHYHTSNELSPLDEHNLHAALPRTLFGPQLSPYAPKSASSNTPQMRLTPESQSSVYEWAAQCVPTISDVGGLIVPPEQEPSPFGEHISQVGNVSKEEMTDRRVKFRSLEVLHPYVRTGTLSPASEGFLSQFYNPCCHTDDGLESLYGFRSVSPTPASKLNSNVNLIAVGQNAERDDSGCTMASSNYDHRLGGLRYPTEQHDQSIPSFEFGKSGDLHPFLAPGPYVDYDSPPVVTYSVQVNPDAYICSPNSSNSFFNSYDTLRANTLPPFLFPASNAETSLPSIAELGLLHIRIATGALAIPQPGTIGSRDLIHQDTMPVPRFSLVGNSLLQALHEAAPFWTEAEGQRQHWPQLIHDSDSEAEGRFEEVCSEDGLQAEDELETDEIDELESDELDELDELQFTELQIDELQTEIKAETQATAKTEVTVETAEEVETDYDGDADDEDDGDDEE